MNEEIRNVGIPNWVIDLLPDSDEPAAMKDEDFYKLKAFIRRDFRKKVVIPDKPTTESQKRFNDAHGRIMVLYAFNLDLRERSAATTIPTPATSHEPTTLEEAEAQGYVEAKVITTLFSQTFSSSSALTKYLDSDERKDLIRIFKPSSNRRLVHAADLLKILFNEHDRDAAALAKLYGEKKPRRNKAGK